MIKAKFEFRRDAKGNFKHLLSLAFYIALTINTSTIAIASVLSISSTYASQDNQSHSPLSSGHHATPTPSTAEIPGSTSYSPLTVNISKSNIDIEKENVILDCGFSSGVSGYPRFARLMHDWQWMPWTSRMDMPDWPKKFYLPSYPETVQLWTSPRGGDGRFGYSPDWLEFLRQLQPDDRSASGITGIGAGLFNFGNEDIPILNLDQLEHNPVAESISSGGNVVKILETFNGSGRIEMIYFKTKPPSTSELNYQKAPWLVTKFTSVSIDGELGNVNGRDLYFPNLSKSEEGYWVALERVEFFPALPFCATTSVGLNVFDQPSLAATQIGEIGPNNNLTILEYMPQGSSVWARTSQGWVLIEYLQNGEPFFTTNWSMETQPPLVFE